jgi:hypothetical protein
MQKGILSIIILVSCATLSCGTLRYNKVYRYRDEFRDNEKAYTRIKVRSDERRTEVGSARVIIEKEISKGGTSVNLYFVIYRSASSFKAGFSGYLKAGDKKYELVLKDPVWELRTKSEASISGIATVDSSGIVTGQTADIDTRTWIEEKFVASLSGEMVAIIVGSAEAHFRFYFGPIAATYIIKGKRLAAVKKVLNQ